MFDRFRKPAAGVRGLGAAHRVAHDDPQWGGNEAGKRALDDIGATRQEEREQFAVNR